MIVVELGSAPGDADDSGLIGDRGREVASDGDHPVDLVISDMAPNMSGVRSADLPRVMSLCELALDLADRVLALCGYFLINIFQGEGFDQDRTQVRGMFDKAQGCKGLQSAPAC